MVRSKFVLTFFPVASPELLHAITGYTFCGINQAFEFVEKHMMEGLVDLTAEFPDYGIEKLVYDYVHHQGYTSKTVEMMVGVVIKHS